MGMNTKATIIAGFVAGAVLFAIGCNTPAMREREAIAQKQAENAEEAERLATEKNAADERVERETARIDAGFGIAEALAIGLAGFIPGGSLAGAAIGTVRKRVREARTTGKVVGADVVVRSIDELRKASPELDAAFGRLGEREKAAAHAVLSTLPDWRVVLNDPVTPDAPK